MMSPGWVHQLMQRSGKTRTRLRSLHDQLRAEVRYNAYPIQQQDRRADEVRARLQACTQGPSEDAGI